MTRYQSMSMDGYTNGNTDIRVCLFFYRNWKLRNFRKSISTVYEITKNKTKKNTTRFFVGIVFQSSFIKERSSIDFFVVIFAILNSYVKHTESAILKRGIYPFSRWRLHMFNIGNKMADVTARESILYFNIVCHINVKKYAR